MDQVKLHDTLKEKGVTYERGCSALGVERSTFWRKCKGVTEFSASELKTLVGLIGFKNVKNIFFDN